MIFNLDSKRLNERRPPIPLSPAAKKAINAQLSAQTKPFPRLKEGIYEFLNHRNLFNQYKAKPKAKPKAKSKGFFGRMFG